MTKRLWPVAALSSLPLLCALFARAQMTDVLTYHNDNGRTGQTLHESILTLANVNSNHFGLLRVMPTDGKVDAQALYAAGVSIPGKGMRNVLFVATEHDSLYAFDADGTAVFWTVSMLGPGETASDNRSCDQVTPEIGVTATPVIDRQLGPNGTIFVVAMSKDGAANYFQRLHALDLATGADRLAPVTVTATYPGTGANSTNGIVVFDPAQYKERPGLLLLNGVIYTAWSSHCDIDPYTGWIIGYDEYTLDQLSVLNITPNGSEGAIWMSGAGLAADSDNFIYFLAGNGTFDTTLTPSGFPNQEDFGNAFMKLSTTSNVLAVVDYFATYQTPAQNSQDMDLGSGGALVLPDMLDASGHVKKLAVGAGKDQNLYVVDRSNMGKFSPVDDSAVYQKFDRALLGGVWAMPAYFNNTLYYCSVQQNLQAFPFANALMSAAVSKTAITIDFPGATPSVSANGTNNGIVWVTENTTPVLLHAYDARDLSQELYNSAQAAAVGMDSVRAINSSHLPLPARVFMWAQPRGSGSSGSSTKAASPPCRSGAITILGTPPTSGPEQTVLSSQTMASPIWSNTRLAWIRLPQSPKSKSPTEASSNLADKAS